MSMIDRADPWIFITFVFNVSIVPRGDRTIAFPQIQISQA
jgi:hypothetical protein